MTTVLADLLFVVVADEVGASTAINPAITMKKDIARLVALTAGKKEMLTMASTAKVKLEISAV